MTHGVIRASSFRVGIPGELGFQGGIEIVGITASIQVKTWLAPDVGPVRELVNTNEGSATSVVADEELLSFTKG